MLKELNIEKFHETEDIYVYILREKIRRIVNNYIDHPNKTNMYLLSILTQKIKGYIKNVYVIDLPSGKYFPDPENVIKIEFNYNLYINIAYEEGYMDVTFSDAFKLFSYKLANLLRKGDKNLKLRETLKVLAENNNDIKNALEALAPNKFIILTNDDTTILDGTARVDVSKYLIHENDYAKIDLGRLRGIKDRLLNVNTDSEEINNALKELSEIDDERAEAIYLNIAYSLRSNSPITILTDLSKLSLANLNKLIKNLKVITDNSELVRVIYTKEN